MVKHLWEAAQKISQKSSGIIERLIVKLSDILKSDFEKSEQGRSKEHLENLLVVLTVTYLIFQSCQKFLSKTIPKKDSDSRRKRISELLDVLKSQKFFPLGE